MSNWHGPPSGSIRLPNNSPLFQGAIHAFNFTTGSWAVLLEDRTGQVVSDGKPDGDNVYLVRETQGEVHTLAHPGGGEVKVNEINFEPFGSWRVLAR